MTPGAAKATRIQLFSFSTPAMRAFHMSWLAFFVCFFAWFSLAPLMPVIKVGVRSEQGSDREHQHRRRRDHDPGSAGDRATDRQVRPAPHLFGAARARCDPGAWASRSPRAMRSSCCSAC